jgi:hypothetical protein
MNCIRGHIGILGKSSLEIIASALSSSEATTWTDGGGQY